MKRDKKSFEKRFLSKIGKIDKSRIRDYLAKLLSQKNFFETIFDHLDEGILVTDGEFRVLYCNSPTREILSLSEHQNVEGERLTTICPEGELGDILASIVDRPRAIQGYECSIGRDETRNIILRATPLAVPAPDSSDESESLESTWVFILHDVTERFRAIEEHSRARRLASLGLLTAGIAHEIKNPLNSLNIHAQILLSESEAGGENALDRKKVARAARVILEETSRLTDIVNEFILAARPQGPMLRLESLNSICDDLARVFAPECEREGIRLKCELDPDLPQMEIDKTLMFQALRNLLRNAIEAHEQDHQEKEDTERETERMILLRTKLTGDSVAIEVADNGPGIPEDQVEKIFEPYYSTKFDGTGLGLMVVYRVVTEHRGSIQVDSRAGLGTRFMITLPLSEKPIRLLEEPKPIPSDPQPSPVS